MDKFTPRHLGHTIKRIYEIVDIDTGEIFKNINNKEYYTVNSEKTYYNEQQAKMGRICTTTIATTRRFVKSKGQGKLEL